MATWTCASAGRDDVNDYAGDGTFAGSVNHGDTVIIPPGDEAWTEQVIVTKGIHLRGSGIGQTIITDQIPSGGPEEIWLRVQVNSPQSFELSGFTFNGDLDFAKPGNQGHIRAEGTSTSPNFKIHDIEVNTPTCSWFSMTGYILGVMYNITYNHRVGNPMPTIILAYHPGASGHGDESWATALDPGGPGNFYVEDCTISLPPETSLAQYVFDGWKGCRVVFRHNSLFNCTLSSHGTETSNRDRGIRWLEAYNNRLEYVTDVTLVDTNFYFRGGSGVFFNNTVVGATAAWGWNSFIKLECRRDAFPSTPWGQCDGSSDYDENQVGEDGYRCVDQPGAGTSNLLDETPAEEWVGNDLEPIYVWNNTLPGAPQYGLVITSAGPSAGPSAHIVEDRDYILDERPNYTPFTYPHPLRERKTKRARVSRGRH